MRRSIEAILLCSFVALLCMAVLPMNARGQDKRWVHFTFDKNLQNTDYYYDRETVRYLSDNRVSVWLKIASPQSEELLHLEIECSGSMFRTIEPYKPLFGSPVKTSYAQYGWLEVPPDSEVFLLKKALCR
ncbi:MAG TPA: hypothetical protein VGJ94_08040 [Syntrophorhabdaceae bacterium]